MILKSLLATSMLTVATLARLPSTEAAAAERIDIGRVLDEAIQDEYRSLETYTQVVKTFGEVRPFSMISRAEGRHVAAITELFRVRGLQLPRSRWTASNVPRYASLQEACAAGVESERRNIVMYDRLLSEELPADVRFVFGNLRSASSERHLPAFERCR